MEIPHEPDPAVELLRRLASDGCASTYIAEQLNGRGIRTNRGTGRWHSRQVYRLAEQHGVQIKYDPGKIRAAQLRDRQHAAT
jgi:hypothetical protein